MKSLVPPFDAYKGDQPYIFISYAHRNSDIVFEHIKKLYSAGYRIWYDEGIDPGTDWSDEIATSLNSAACFLVFMSPEAVDSHNVKKEIVFAVGKRKLMVCVYIAETELPLGLEMQLGNIQGIPETAFINKDKFYTKLINALPTNTKGEANTLKEVIVDNNEQPKVNLTPINNKQSEDFEINGDVLTRYLGSLRVLTIPSGITVIGPQAFAECRSLESVIIPDGVKSIETTAFVNCVNLIQIYLPKTVTSIAYGAFTNCIKLTVRCWKDTPSHQALMQAWRGPITFLDDPLMVNKPTPIRVDKAPESINSVPSQIESKNLADVITFKPKGTAIVTMNNGTKYTAIANTVIFVSSFEDHLGPALYQGLDENPQRKGYKLEDMVYFEDMKKFTVNIDNHKVTGVLDIIDYNDVKKTKRLFDLQEQLWFIDIDKPTDMMSISVLDLLSVEFDYRNTPACTLPMALLNRIDFDDLLVPQAFIKFNLRDFSRGMPREYWSVELPLIENANVALKRLKSFEITKIIHEAEMYKPNTEIELNIEKRNGEVFQDKLNCRIDIYVLSKAGLISPRLTTIKKITFDAMTI